MAIYYVKNGGTATGDNGRVTTARTSTWNASTADYYDSIYDVFAGGVPTTAPVAGDFVYCSSSHNKDYTVDTDLEISTGVTVISVDNANQENYLKGAQETTSTLKNLTLFSTTTTGVYCAEGVIFKASNDLFICGGENSKAVLTDCELFLTGTSALDYMTITEKDGCRIIFNNVELNFNNSGQSVELRNGCVFEWNGGALNNSIAYLFEISGFGGCLVYLNNLDLTNITSAVSKLLGSASADLTTINVNKTKLASGIVLDDSTPVMYGSKICGTSLGISDFDAYHYFNEISLQGDVSEDTAIYRDAGSTYDGTNEFSCEMIGNANTSLHDSLKFELANFYIDTADYTTDITFTIHLARNNGTLLQDDEFWIEIEHPDGADNALGVLVDTKSAPLTAGTNLTDETGGWTGLTGSEGTNHQVMSANSGAITIGASAGNIASGAVKVNVYLAINDTVFVCGKVEIA